MILAEVFGLLEEIIFDQEEAVHQDRDAGGIGGKVVGLDDNHFVLLEVFQQKRS